MDLELEKFKTVDMRLYAAAQGYQLDRKESWAGSAVMRHSNNDKIIIKRDSDGHYVYFSVRDDADNGTIIDFAKRRLGVSLGAARKELRSFMGLAASEFPPYPPLSVTRKDRVRVEIAYAKMQDARRHPYLENERRIPARLLELDRFAGRIRIDGRSNAVFPHFDEQGLCGFELKNSGFTGFSRGGTKGLWSSHAAPDDNQLVVCESAIDALSYAALFPSEHGRYASLGGQINHSVQPELIRAAVARMPTGSEIVSAMDADSPGQKLCEVVHRAVELSGRADVRFRNHEPSGFKDWNDQLRARPRPPQPSRREEPSVA